jgi:hypothetical protein
VYNNNNSNNKDFLQLSLHKKLHWGDLNFNLKIKKS